MSVPTVYQGVSYKIIVPVFQYETKLNFVNKFNFMKAHSLSQDRFLQLVILNEASNLLNVLGV